LDEINVSAMFDYMFSSRASWQIAKTKKPAAGGGAAGFSEITERQLGGGVLSFLQTVLGGGVNRLIHEVGREEMPYFDVYIILYFLQIHIDHVALQRCNFCIALFVDLYRIWKNIA